MELNAPVGRTDRTHPPLFFQVFCITAGGMRVRAAFVVCALITGLFFMIPASPVYSAQTRRLSAETKPRSQAITFIEPRTVYENMYSCIQARERAGVNNTFAFSNSQRTWKDDAAEKNPAQLPRTSQRFVVFFLSFFYCGFCVLIIKNNNGLLSLPRRQGLSEEE